MDFVLDVPERNHIAFGSQDQLLLISVGGVTGDLLEGLSNDRTAGLGFLVRRRRAVHNDRFTGSSVQIANSVLYLLPCHINEGEYVLPPAMNIHGERMAADLGEITGPVVFLQFRTRLGIEGLGRTCQGAAGGVIRNIGERPIRILNSIFDGIRHQRVGTPLGIEVQIAVDGHGEVKRFFLAAVADVEPADEGISPVGGGIRLIDRRTVGDFRPGIQFRSPVIHYILGQIRLDRVGLGGPLGVEDHVGGRHGHGVQVSLGTLIAASRGVPAVEHIGVLFQIGRIFRFEIITAQWCLKLHTSILTCNIGVIVVEAQIIAVTGVAKIVFVVNIIVAISKQSPLMITCISDTALLHFVKLRIGPPLRKTSNIVKFLRIC